MESRTTGRKVGRYSLDYLIGEGGFAEVYSAWDEDGGTVAIKLLKSGAASREMVKRFQAEQRVLRALNHRGIVRVTDSGETEDGRAFFVMEQVDGLPITEFCVAERLPFRERAKLFTEVCDAVQHAHQKGVIHRDLKPANILVASDSSPKVIDFGIAKAMEDDGSTGNTLVTRLGQVMGTPAYMSPEQAAGSDEADTRSDVYALGAVFFEMLTGRAPFDAADFQKRPPAAWATFITNTEPGAPSTQVVDAKMPSKELRGDLDAIVMRAMAREPERRYASVQELGDDVRRWLTGGAVVARPPSLRYQLKRVARRHKLAAAIFLALTAAVLTAMVAAFVLARQSQRAEAAMGIERDKARRAQDRAERESYQAALHLARLHLANGEPYLAAARLHATKPALRGWEWGHLLSATPKPEMAMESGLREASKIAASRDGATALVRSDRVAHLLDVKSGAVLAKVEFPANIASAAVADDGALFAFALATEPGTLRVLRRDGSLACEIPFENNSPEVAWEPGADGALLAVSGNGSKPTPGRLLRIERATGRILAEREILRHKINNGGIAASPSGRYLLVRDSYASFIVYALPSLATVQTNVPFNNALIDDVLFDEAAGRIVFTVDNTVQQTKIAVPENQQILHFDNNIRVRRLALLPDGKILAISDTAELTEDGTSQRRPAAEERSVARLSGSRRMALLDGGRVEIRPETIGTPTGALPVKSFGTLPEGRQVAFSADSGTVAVQTWERYDVQLLDVKTFAERSWLTGSRDVNRERILLPVWHPDGSLISIREGKVFADRNGEPSAKPLPVADTVWSAAPTPDGSRVAFGTAKGITILDWKTRAVLRELPLEGAPFHVFTHANGATFFALDSRRKMHVIGETVASFEFPEISPSTTDYPATASYHAGRNLFALGTNSAVTIFELSPTRAPRVVHRIVTDALTSALAFDPSGRRLAVATRARRLTIWDWEETLPLVDFPIRATASSVAFSPDGRWLVNTDFSPTADLRDSQKH